MSGGVRSCAALLCGFVVATGGVAAGCDGGSEESTAEERPPKYSKASEPPRNFAERLAKLLATTRGERGCSELDAINARSPTRFPCPPAKALSESMEQFEIVDVGEYGTGAVIDYTSGEATQGATIVLMVASDRNWAVSRFGVLTEPSTETSDEESREGFEQAVDDYLAAVRDRDCEAFEAVMFSGDGEIACEALLSRTRRLAKRLKDDPAAAPTYQGGNATYGFFTLETREPRPTLLNSTIAVIEAAPGSPSPYLILDVAPSPTGEEQRRVIRALKLQDRKDPEPERSPSRRVESQ